MIRDWFKDLLKEVFSDDIENMHNNFLEKKYGEAVDKEIVELLAPLRVDVSEFRSNLQAKLKEIDKSVNVELKNTKKMVDTSLAKVVESLPKKLEKLEINIDGLQETLNNKVQKVVSQEITRSHDSYNRNNLVLAVRSQFKTFTETHDFVSGITKKPESK